jgi:exopolysaccharide biosynthesis polyprenyl glycosylphosphotransferase
VLSPEGGVVEFANAGEVAERQVAPAAPPVGDAYAERQTSRAGLMRRLLIAADVAGLTVAFAVVQLLIGDNGVRDAVSPSDKPWLFIVSIPFWFLGANLIGLYSNDAERADHSTSDELARVFVLMTVGVFLAAWVAADIAGHNPDELKLRSFWGVAIVAISGLRIIARTIARRRTSYSQTTVIVGAGEVGQLIARKLMQHVEYGLNLIGFVDARPRARRTHLAEFPVLGGLDDLEKLVAKRGVDRVVVAFSSDPHHEVITRVRRLREIGIQVDIVPRFFEAIGPKLDVHAVEGVPLLGLAPVHPSHVRMAVKRTIDVLGASLAFVVFAPILVCAALAIKLESPGPVLYRQVRLGRNQRRFTLLKFRTMKADTDDREHRKYIAAMRSADASPNENGLFKLLRPDAITRVGAFLRRTSLDELPQLINVLKGDMSLVGPRPCIPYEVEHFSPHHFERFRVPAGLTGLWQVSARAHSTFAEALDMDVLYAQNHSLGLDLRLLARTPLQLLRARETA